MNKTFTKFCLLLALCAPAFSPALSAAAVTEQLVDLVKPNSTPLRYLLTRDDALAADTGVILFSGGGGEVKLAKGIPRPGANFLVRSRQLFAQNGLAVAVYDPSRDIGSLSDHARMSPTHFDEVAQVLADFRQRAGVKKIYLVGTSRGTISAAYLAVALQEKVDGVVLSSSVFQSSRGGVGLSSFDFSSIQRPLLFVHHVADACKVTSPGYARSMEKKYPVIWVEGVAGEEGDECGPYSAHGYLGREAATVRAISSWILGRKLTPRIESNTVTEAN